MYFFSANDKTTKICVSKVIDHGADVNEEVYDSLLAHPSDPKLRRANVFKEFKREQKVILASKFVNLIVTCSQTFTHTNTLCI